MYNVPLKPLAGKTFKPFGRSKVAKAQKNQTLWSHFPKVLLSRPETIFRLEVET
jgi:hypothetical protein